eukprot:gene26300-32242_t
MGQELSKEAEDLQSELEEALIFAKGAGHPSAYSLGFRVQTMKENVEESVRSLQRTAALQEALKETNWTLTRRINELMQQLADCSENNSEKPREKTELYDSAATRTSDVRTFERTEALQQQRIDEAIRSFKEALTCPDRHPLGDAAVHTYLGNLYLNNLNDARLAAIHFQDAARLSPSSPDKHLNVALVNFNHLEDVEAAARACLKALALGKVRKPPWTGLVQAQYLLARILSKQGKREEAAVLIREVNNKTNAVDPMVPKLFRWAPEAVGSLQPLGIISPCSAGGKELVAETLSLRPLVLRVRGFLSPKECQGIIDLSKPKMEESVSVHGLSSKDSTKARQHRQSKTGWLPMRQNAILASLRSRLGALLALPASVLEASEQLQVGTMESTTMQ